MTGYAGELKVSWWVCYLVIRTLLIGFSFVSFFFPSPSPSSFSFCGKVSNEALRVYSLRSVCGLVCPFGGELFELER